MGIRIKFLSLPSRVTINNAYISFRHEPIHISTSTEGYIIHTHYKIFKEDGDVLERVDHFVHVSPSDIDEGIFTILYDHLKTMFPNSTDEMDYSPMIPDTPVR